MDGSPKRGQDAGDGPSGPVDNLGAVGTTPVDGLDGVVWAVRTLAVRAKALQMRRTAAGLTRLEGIARDELRRLTEGELMPNGLGFRERPQGGAGR